MPFTGRDIEAAFALLVETFPQTFVLEKYRPHQPLKVGIDADLLARCPILKPREFSVVLRAYTSRVMYLQNLVAGAACIDLDGNPAGAVTAAEAEHTLWIAPHFGTVLPQMQPLGDTSIYPALAGTNL